MEPAVSAASGDRVSADANVEELRQRDEPMLTAGHFGDSPVSVDVLNHLVVQSVHWAFAPPSMPAR
jgi:hypothetical protein